MGEAILTNRFIPNNSSVAIGDIRLSCRTDLGDNYLLCNGANMHKGNSSNEALEIVRDVSGCNYNIYEGYYKENSSSTTNDATYEYYVFDENSSNIYLLRRQENRKLRVTKYNNYIDLDNSNPSTEFVSTSTISSLQISNARVFKNFIFISVKGYSTGGENAYEYTYKVNITTGKIDQINGCSSFVIKGDYIYIAINPERGTTGSGITLQRSKDGINFTNTLKIPSIDNFNIYNHKCYTDEDSDKIFIFVARNTDIPNSIYGYYMYIIDTNSMTVTVDNHSSNLYMLDQYLNTGNGGYGGCGIPICDIIYYNNTYFFNIDFTYFTRIYTLKSDNNLLIYKDSIINLPTYENRIYYKPFKINNELYIRKNDKIYKYDNSSSKFVSLLTTKDKFDKQIPNIYNYNISYKPELVETSDGYIYKLNMKWYFCPKLNICTILPIINSTDIEYVYIKTK